MHIIYFPGVNARFGAFISSIAAVQLQRRGSLYLPVVDPVMYMYVRPSAHPRRFLCSHVSRQHEAQYLRRPISVSPHRGCLYAPPAPLCSTCDRVYMREPQKTTLYPAQELAERFPRKSGYNGSVCSKENKCNRETESTTTATEVLPSVPKTAECGAHFKTKGGVLAQPRCLPSLLLSSPHGCVTRGAADITYVKNGASAWQRNMHEYRQGSLDNTFSLKDEGGTQTLLMSPAAVQRLETLCARRRLQQSTGGTANTGNCVLPDERRPEGISDVNARRPIVGLRVRVTSGGCSGYQYSFGLLSSEEVQKLRENKEYSVFWPPSRLDTPITSTETWRTTPAQVVPPETTAPEMEGHSHSCEANTGTSHIPAGCENDGVGLRSREKEKQEVGQWSSEKMSACALGWCVFVDRCSLPLFGNKAVIDFEDTLAASEFIVQQNDRAENVCSCGRSFALKDEF